MRVWCIVLIKIRLVCWSLQKLRSTIFTEQAIGEKNRFIVLYDLIVYGNMIAGGTVDEPIKRHPVDRVKMAVLPGGKDAVTHYNVKERFQHFTRVQARLGNWTYASDSCAFKLYWFWFGWRSCCICHVYVCPQVHRNF